MTVSHSDALVFFGATGDLAYKKIFPALQAMAKRGLRFRISPELTLAFGMNVVAPSEDTISQRVEMIASRHPRADEMDAYERVLGDAMAGDATLFAREDYVEEAWRIVDPVLTAGTPVYQYQSGAWGPKEVDSYVSPPGGWQNPYVSAT